MCEWAVCVHESCEGGGEGERCMLVLCGKLEFCDCLALLASYP